MIDFYVMVLKIVFSCGNAVALLMLFFGISAVVLSLYSHGICIKEQKEVHWSWIERKFYGLFVDRFPKRTYDSGRFKDNFLGSMMRDFCCNEVDRARIVNTFGLAFMFVLIGAVIIGGLWPIALPIAMWLGYCRLMRKKNV